jgi:hypothetical protein
LSRLVTNLERSQDIIISYHIHPPYVPLAIAVTTLVTRTSLAPTIVEQ